MKHILIILDGVADYPIAKWNNKTPLMVADTPYLNQFAKRGKTGRLQSVPKGHYPESTVATLTILGYETMKMPSRATIEALGIGIQVKNEDIFFRCNLVSLENDRLKSHSANHIENSDAKQLITDIQQFIAYPNIELFAGNSYQNLLKVNGLNTEIKLLPPHDAIGQNYEKLFPTPTTEAGKKTALLLNDFLQKSHSYLRTHPINIKRQKQGKLPANAFALWGGGKYQSAMSFEEKYNGKRGAVVAGVPIIRGIGEHINLKIKKLQNATGYFDTDYTEKARATINALTTHDFALLHIEAPDEAGHEGNPILKKQIIGEIDKKVLKPIAQHIEKSTIPISIAIMPDHYTPCELQKHTCDAVPFLIYHKGIKADSVQKFDENSVINGELRTMKGIDFMPYFLQKKLIK